MQKRLVSQRKQAKYDYRHGVAGAVYRPAQSSDDVSPSNALAFIVGIAVLILVSLVVRQLLAVAVPAMAAILHDQN
jgi:hypothetical protein